MPTKEDFAAMHHAMAALVDEQDRVGWQSPAVEEAAKMLRFCLWECANNDEVQPAALRALKEYCDALEKATVRK